MSPDACALVVKYELEVSVVGYSGEVEVVELKKGRKEIKVRGLGPRKNVKLLARDIVEKSKLIHSSKLGRVEELLRVLQDRGYGGAGPGAEGEDAAEADDQLLHRGRSSMGMAMEMLAAEAGAGGGSADDLDDYLEALYDEDLEQKVEASAKIALLVKRTDRLEPLLAHESLLGALARVLREDGKKSVDLSINVLSVFFALSHFSQFHQFIAEHQIGDMSMKLLDLECRRTELREREEGAPVAQQMMRALENASRDPKEAKLVKVLKRQDKLLYVATYLLLNISEDVATERKMKRRNIVEYLVKILGRLNVELLILAVTFLKKLSIYKENKEKMAAHNIVAKLIAFVPCRNEVLLTQTFRLLHNLSFDSTMRDAMVRHGLIPKAVDLLQNPAVQPIVMGLLYHISFEDKYKSVFTYTEAIDLVYTMLLNEEDLRSSPELIALAVNLSQNAKNAEIMVAGDRLRVLMEHALASGDDLLFKVIRNIGQQDSLKIKLKFKDFIPELVRLLKAEDTSTEVLVEVLGTLGNLAIPQFDYGELVERHGLMEFLGMLLQPGVTDDDVLLEAVIFVGAITGRGTLPALVEADVPGKLFVLMSEKKEDDEMVLQIAYAFSKLLQFELSRDALLQHPQVVYYLVDLLHDKNGEVRKVADRCLDTIVEAEPPRDGASWSEKVRGMKFEAYNQEWLEIVEADSEQQARLIAAAAAQGQILEEDAEIDHVGSGYNGLLDYEHAHPALWQEGDAAVVAEQAGARYGGRGGGLYEGHGDDDGSAAGRGGEDQYRGWR